jgi:hypothetical protein
LALATCLVFALCAQAQKPAPAAQTFDVAGTIVNSLNGDLVPGATLKLTPDDATTPLAQARSGDDGSFRFAAVPPGKYQLQAARRGFTTRLYEQHDNFNSAVIVAAGQDTAHLVFRLPPLALIRGVVTGDSGEPVEGAQVLLFRKPGIEDPEGRIFRAAGAMTDDTGAYEFADLQPGEYLIAVRAHPWWAMHAPPSPGQPPSELDVAYPVTYFDSTTEEVSATPVRITAGSRVDANISLHAVPAVRITVVQPGLQTGQVNPVELRQSLFGSLDNSDGDIQVTRNSRGEAEFYGIAPGHYELTSGFPAHTQQLDTVSSGVVDGSVGVPSATVTGKVETAPGVAYDQPAFLTLVPSDPAQREITSIVMGGKFGLEDVPAGVWTAKLRNGYGHDLQIHSIQIAGHTTAGNRFTATGQTQELVIAATQGAVNVVGTAQKDGKGLAGVLIVLVAKDLKDSLSLARRDQSDSDGSFVLMNAVPGDYTVVAIQDAWDLDWSRPEVIARYLPAGQSVTIPVGATGEFRLPRPVVVQQR